MKYAKIGICPRCGHFRKWANTYTQGTVECLACGNQEKDSEVFKFKDTWKTKHVEKREISKND